MNWLKRLMLVIRQYLFTRFGYRKNNPKMLPKGENIIEPEIFDIKSNDEKLKINVSERTISSRLYMAEQSVSAFKDISPAKYNEFIKRVKVIKTNYEKALDESKKSLTTEVDPDFNFKMLGEIFRLEADIECFIEKDLKYILITKRLQRLILKLNILYNVSIWYSSKDDKAKCMNQLSHAKDAEAKLVKDIKHFLEITRDIHLKEEFVSYIAYLDYLIFKNTIRSSDRLPSEVICNLAIVTEFAGFEYISMFVAFVKEELLGMNEYLDLIQDEAYKNSLKRNHYSLSSCVSYIENDKSVFCSRDFWENVFDFESEVFTFLKGQGLDKSELNIKVVSNLNFHDDGKDDLISLPKVNAIIALTSAYYKSHDKRLMVLNKLLKNISDKVTYRELYFLIVLFDALDLVRRYSNDINVYLDKYAKKYPYSQSSLEERKKQVKNSSNKKYLHAFKIDEVEGNIPAVLDSLNLDYKIEGKNVLINSHYFSGLDNILASLTESITI